MERGRQRKEKGRGKRECGKRRNDAAGVGRNVRGRSECDVMKTATIFPSEAREWIGS